jgi:hypothetical protein
VVIAQTEPTPEPTVTVVPVPVDPDTIDRLLEVSATGAAVIALAVMLILGAAILIAWAVIRSAQLPPPTALITSLALLSLFAIAGGIATDNDASWTIAAAGVGALAGSVTSIFQEGRYKPEDVEKAVAVVQELDRQEQANRLPPPAAGVPPTEPPSTTQPTAPFILPFDNEDIGENR